MTKWLIGLTAVVLCGVLAINDADARGRLGGGRSTGAQRSVPNNPPAATPARPGQQQAAPNQAPAQQAQPSGLSRWMPMLGGLALGGLLGYLFAGNGMGGILLLVLLAIGAVMVFRMLSRKREAPQPMQYAGVGRETGVAPPPPQASGLNMQATTASQLPAGFDATSFLRGAKMNFMKLQAANDRGQVDDLREFTTDEMFEELKKDITERGGASQQTDVEGLNADLLEVATEGDRHWASVRFSGLVREAPGATPAGFEEVWNLVKPANGSSGWLLAGIQQMH
jgi:predicted lipid-binding transport protein (Tim44 family)